MSNNRRPTLTPDNAARVWQERTDLVKHEMEVASAASDAKTARLKALRLEKEAQEAEVARNTPPPEPKRRKHK